MRCSYKCFYFVGYILMKKRRYEEFGIIGEEKL